MNFYSVDRQKLWGDYGHILIHGMSRHLPRKDGLIQLERTGPFLPPISLPGAGDVVIIDDFKRALEGSGLARFEFSPVIKARIVEYHWDRWDRSREEPVEYPVGGEPEGYILSRPHAPEIAEGLGSLWQVGLPEDAEVESIRVGRGAFEYKVDHSTWQGSHLFRANGKGRVMATEEGKRWLEKRAGEWLAFQAARL